MFRREHWPLNDACLDTQSRPTLCDPQDCSPPGSFVLGILQARIVEWVAISLSLPLKPCSGGASSPPLSLLRDHSLCYKVLPASGW